MQLHLAALLASILPSLSAAYLVSEPKNRECLHSVKDVVDVPFSVRSLYTAAQILSELAGRVYLYLPGYLSSQVARPLQVVSAVTVIFKVFNALTWHRQHLM